MDRRKFMRQGLAGAATLSALSSHGLEHLGAAENAPAASAQGTGPSAKALTAQDVQDYLRSLGADWVDPASTVDTFKAGDPRVAVKGIAVGWMSYFQSLRKAREMGCNLFITHEPTYYDHVDRDQSVFAFETAKEKRAFIAESGMVILRCHDLWDRVAKIGIRDAWARFLGLDREIETRIASDRSKGRPFCGAYQIAPTTARDLARKVAGKLAAFGQDAVLLVGPEDKLVRSVAVGTGAITPFREMVQDLKTDLAICTDDGFSFWQDGSLAIDMEYPVIVVNHPCSEEVGVQRLAEHLAERFPQVAVHHIAQSCMFKCVRP